MNEIILDKYTLELIIDAVINTASYDNGLSGITNTSSWNIPLNTLGYHSCSGLIYTDTVEDNYDGIPLGTRTGGDY